VYTTNLAPCYGILYKKKKDINDKYKDDENEDEDDEDDEDDDRDVNDEDDRDDNKSQQNK
jgi:hypothetical protein